MPDVLLINMPFTNLFTPSIGLGLLKASLSRIGISAKGIDFHLRFAELIGQEVYHSIERKTYPEHLVGEWIFSESLFHHPKNSNQELLTLTTLKSCLPSSKQTLRLLRKFVFSY